MAKTNEPFNFTDAAIKSLCKDVKNGDVLPGEWRDSETNVGLLIRVGPRGAVYYSQRRHNGQKKRIRIGDFATMSVKTAREKATQLAAGVATAAARPARSKGDAIRCQDAFDAYIAAAKGGTFRKGHKPLEKTTLKSYVELWNPHCKKIYGQRSLLHLANDIEAIHAKLNNNPGSQKKFMQVLKNLFEYSIRQGWWKDTNPLIDPVTGKTIACRGTQDRERFLSDSELKLWMEWVENQDEPWPDFYKLALLTGIRKSTVCAMAWKDLDTKSKKATWRLTDEQNKNDKPLIVPLLSESVAILRKRFKQRKKNCPWVFPTTGVTPSESGHIEEPSHSWDRMREATGIEDIRLHDVRRTTGTTAARANKHSLAEVARFLGQRTLKAASIYARAGEHEAREVGATIEDALRQAQE